MMCIGHMHPYIGMNLSRHYNQDTGDLVSKNWIYLNVIGEDIPIMFVYE